MYEGVAERNPLGPGTYVPQTGRMYICNPDLCVTDQTFGKRDEAMYRAVTHPVNQSTRKPGAKGAVHVDKFGAGFARRVKALCSPSQACPLAIEGSSIPL